MAPRVPTAAADSSATTNGPGLLGRSRRGSPDGTPCGYSRVTASPRPFRTALTRARRSAGVSPAHGFFRFLPEFVVLADFGLFLLPSGPPRFLATDPLLPAILSAIAARYGDL